MKTERTDKEKFQALAELRDKEYEQFKTILKLAERQAFSPHFVALCVSEYLRNEEEV